jgi:multiple sugar transport system substrate-binding protein
VVDSPEAIRALTFMREQIGDIAPAEVLTWHEEESRFAFQNGNAVFMRNWPYAYSLLQDTSASRVAGKVAVAPMPPSDGGSATAALGGAQLAVNRNSRHPDAARRLVHFLTHPDRVRERSIATGQFPSLPSLYADSAVAAALAVPAAQALDVVSNARARPVTPLYSQLSELLQIQLHRALTGQATPEIALADAAREMNELLQRAGL